MYCWFDLIFIQTKKFSHQLLCFIHLFLTIVLPSKGYQKLLFFSTIANR